jgi:SCP-2 sterol transfer family protein
MNTDPLAFFRQDFPALFNRGVADLKKRGDGGDAKAKARYEDTSAARGVVRIVLEGKGGGELFLTVRGGEMNAVDAAPSDLPVRMALSAPADAARAGLEELANAKLLEREKAPTRIARSASAEIEKALEGHRIEFHVTLTDLPAEPDEVTLRIGIGVDTPPTSPKFTATVSWDDIEDLRAGDLTPQQLFGRLKIKGDASQAMALGMSLMQRRQKS